MHVLYLKVGPVVYKIVSEADLLPQSDCAEFFTPHRPKVSNGEIFVHCLLQIVEVSSRIEGKIVYQDASHVILNSRGLERRLILKGQNVAAYYWEKDEYSVVIEVHQESKAQILIDTDFLEAFALERFLLCGHTLVLHAAFIEWQGKGVLFTAPSGTGKSTQASLWNQYEGTEIINGDRALLVQDMDAAVVDCCGLPFCGSSGIHCNKRIPLGAIVFIDQASMNIVKYMSRSDAVRRLFIETSINKWNDKAVIESLDLIEHIVAKVPMVHLKCNMEYEAVCVLKEFLQTLW